MNQLQMLKTALMGYVNSMKAVWSKLAYPLSIISKRNGNLKDYRIYGNTFQDGEPSPDNPVEIQSVGDLVSEGEQSGKYRIGVVTKGKNLYKPTRVSTGGFATPSASVSLSNNYGTTISTTDATKGEFTVTQTQVANPSASAWGVYQNGYFCFETGQGVFTAGKTYTLSFDCEILNNLMETDYFGVMPNGGDLQQAIAVNGRVSVNFQYTLNNSRDNYIEIRVGGKSFKISNIMITEVGESTDYEAYREPHIFNIFLDEPLCDGEYIDFEKGKVVRENGEEEVNLPDIPTTRGTTVCEINTNISARISGEYKKMEE